MAEWFLGKGHLEEALKHALEAGAWDLAIMTLENEGGWRIALKHGADVLNGIEAIPAAAMQASLLTRLTLVYLLLHLGQINRAREAFEELRSESGDFSAWRGETLAANVRAECRALEAIIIIDEERPLPVGFVERIKQEASSPGDAWTLRADRDRQRSAPSTRTTTPAITRSAFASRSRVCSGSGTFMRISDLRTCISIEA